MKNYELKIKTKNKSKSDGGFTIIETLVALSIFTLSILGILVATSFGISDSTFVKNRLTATYLAQEGLELVHNVRDAQSLYADASPWTTFLSSLSSCVPTPTSSGCDIDPRASLSGGPMTYSGSPTPVLACPLAGCSIVYDDSTGFYKRSNDSEAVFKRYITIGGSNPLWINYNPDGEVNVVSTVVFSYGGSTGTVSVSENLLNWINPAP